MVAKAPSEDLAALERQAAALAAQAEAQAQAYQRATWKRFVGVFFPIPFVVVLLRLEIAAWTYFVWGALILGGGAVLYIIDTAASDRVDAAAAAADKARQALDDARARPRRATPP